MPGLLASRMEAMLGDERFADVVSALARDSDLVWVHDYHLMLLPSMNATPSISSVQI